MTDLLDGHTVDPWLVSGETEPPPDWSEILGLDRAASFNPLVFASMVVSAQRSAESFAECARRIEEVMLTAGESIKNLQRVLDEARLDPEYPEWHPDVDPDAEDD